MWPARSGVGFVLGSMYLNAFFGRGIPICKLCRCDAPTAKLLHENVAPSSSHGASERLLLSENGLF